MKTSNGETGQPDAPNAAQRSDEPTKAFAEEPAQGSEETGNSLIAGPAISGLSTTDRLRGSGKAAFHHNLPQNPGRVWNYGSHYRPARR